MIKQKFVVNKHKLNCNLTTKILVNSFSSEICLSLTRVSKLNVVESAARVSFFSKLVSLELDVEFFKSLAMNH